MFLATSWKNNLQTNRWRMESSLVAVLVILQQHISSGKHAHWRQILKTKAWAKFISLMWKLCYF